MKKMDGGAYMPYFVDDAVLSVADVPFDIMKANVNSILEMLREPKFKGEADKKLKEQRIEAAAVKLSVFVELSKRTLGLHWTQPGAPLPPRSGDLTALDRDSAITKEFYPDISVCLP